MEWWIEKTTNFQHSIIRTFQISTSLRLQCQNLNTIVNVMHAHHFRVASDISSTKVGK